MSNAPITHNPLPASRKVYLKSDRLSLAVPMREITLTPTKSKGGGAPSIEANPPFLI
jgi:phosphomethylpyrimidine synthase